MQHAFSDDSRPVQIRGHHLLCLQGYQGYGYSQRFVDNLNKILDQIHANPDLIIEVTAQNDSICLVCPFAGLIQCNKSPDSEYTARAMDLHVLQKIHCSENTRGPALHFIERVNDVFSTKATLQALCGDCQWQTKCLWFQSRLD